MHNRHFVFEPMPNQSLGIMQPMNPMQQPDAPIVDTLIPADYFAPVEDMSPYGPSQQIGSVQDAIAVLSVTDLLFGG